MNVLTLLFFSAESTPPVKQIDFSSPTESEGDESAEPTHTVPIVRCTGLTTELDNLLIKAEFSSSGKRPNEIFNTRKDKGSCHSNENESDCDDEVTFNSKALGQIKKESTDFMKEESCFKHTDNKENMSLLSPSMANSLENSICSPTGQSSGYGTCNISGVTTLTDTTQVSLAQSDVEDRSLRKNEEIDSSDSLFYSDKSERRVKYDDITLLSPVGDNMLKHSPHPRLNSNMQLTPPYVNIHCSVGSMSPMDIQEHHRRSLSSSSPLQTVEEDNIIENVEASQCKHFQDVREIHNHSKHMSMSVSDCVSIPPMCTPVIDRQRISSSMDMSIYDNHAFRTPAQPTQYMVSLSFSFFRQVIHHLKK